MSEFRKVTDAVSVAPQIAVSDIARAAGEGFRLVINNRPDDEEPGQPSNAAIQAAAKAAGLDYVHLPFVGRPSAQMAEQVRQVIDDHGVKTLMFCRTGTRCINVWALGQALAGRQSPDDLVRLGFEAGYDVRGTLGG
jgi:uncharacterized protein (TIGR01244 family)